MKQTTYLLLVLLGSLMGCDKAAIDAQLQEDIAAIEQDIAKRNLSAFEDDDAHFFYRHEVNVYNGIFPVRNSGIRLVVNYDAEMLDGTILHSSSVNPDTIPLDRAVIGWKLAAKHLNIGDKMQLWLPSNLAYGTDGNEWVPPNTPLYFNIELVDIHPHF